MEKCLNIYMNQRTREANLNRPEKNCRIYNNRSPSWAPDNNEKHNPSNSICGYWKVHSHNGKKKKRLRSFSLIAKYCFEV